MVLVEGCYYSRAALVHKIYQHNIMCKLIDTDKAENIIFVLRVVSAKECPPFCVIAECRFTPNSIYDKLSDVDRMYVN